MKIQEIIERALEQNAILFLGAGFSVGARNYSKCGEFPIADELCKILIQEGKIDIKGEAESDIKDLQYISTRFLDTNTKRDLIGILKRYYCCTSVGEEHEIVASLPWKKIYTTNYDNVMEEASKCVGINREPVEIVDKLRDVYDMKNAIIHLNGYAYTLTESGLDSSFKLTSASYHRRTFADSEWATALHNDIKNAKSVVFIGYSLDYDLELQQIFASDETLREKCLFVCYDPTPRQERSMKEFGNVYKEGLLEFSKIVKNVKAEYKPESKSYELKVFERIEVPSQLATAVNAEDVVRLFIDGSIKREITYSSNEYLYLFKRSCVLEIMNFILNEGKVAIVHSDLANGKSVILEQIETGLLEKASVYRFNGTFDTAMSDDLEYISRQKGLHVILCESYNQLINTDVWEIICKYQYSNIKYVFTARSYINDNFWGKVCRDMDLTDVNFAMFDVNELNETEIIELEKLISRYNLWGKNYSRNRNLRIKSLMKRNRCEIRDVLIDMYESPNVAGRIQSIIKLISRNSDAKNVLIYTFICNILSMKAETFEMTKLFGSDIVKRINTSQLSELRELVLLERNVVKLKSSSIAKYILRNNNYNNDVLRIIKEMVNRSVANSYIPSCANMLRDMISFSNLRLLFNENDRELKNKYVEFYENARKTDYYSKNQFFWIQYAIAVMDIKDYESAHIFLENASALAIERFSEDSYQVDNLRARLLLERTLYENDARCAFDNFEEAHHLICSNKTPERHYPYRQASYYIEYHRKFYPGFTNEQRVAFMQRCFEIKKRIDSYLSQNSSFERNERKKDISLKRTSRDLDQIIASMAKD